MGGMINMLLNGTFNKGVTSWESNKPHRYFEKTRNGQTIRLDKTILFGIGSEPSDEELEKLLDSALLWYDETPIL